MGLAGMLPQLQRADVSTLGQLGALDRGLAQAQADATREANRMAAFQPQEQIDRYANIVTGIMGGYPGQTQTTNIPNPTPLQNALAIASTGAGIYKALGQGSQGLTTYIMNRTLRRPMFRMGGSTNEGITSGLDTPKRGLVDGPGKYSQPNNPNALKLDYNISQMFPTTEEMDEARKYYKPYFERPEGEGLSRFLINFGLNLASTPPMGKGFSGLISTAAGAAKEPTKELFEDLDREKLQKNVADADCLRLLWNRKETYFLKQLVVINHQMYLKIKL